MARKKQEYRKITLNVPVELLERALAAGGDNLTQTVRKGLELIAAKQAFDELRTMRGQVEFSVPVSQLREDRK